jgi:hypothetical protein
MRTPGRRRPRKSDRLGSDAKVDLTVITEKVTYVPSPEHKDYLTVAGPGMLRSDASACPRGLDFDEVVEWLRDAVRRGDVSADLKGGFATLCMGAGPRTGLRGAVEQLRSGRLQGLPHS